MSKPDKEQQCELVNKDGLTITVSWIDIRHCKEGRELGNWIVKVVYRAKRFSRKERDGSEYWVYEP